MHISDIGHGIETPDHKRENAWRAILILCAIVALGAALRLYRLADQSIWLDEYPSVAYLNAPNAWTNIVLFQMYLPEQAQGPLYYILQYFWAHAVGMSLPTLRLLPLLLSLSAIPLIFLLGRYLYNVRAGLVAALCLALSPQHIWHAQEIRPYALITPLVILSIYALLRALREGRTRWWAVNLAVNALLVWTHAFAILLLPVEGLFLLALFPGRFRRTAAWAGIQLLLLVPWVVWMLRMPFSYTSELPSYFHSVRRVFNTIFADDVVSRHSDLLPVWKTHPPHFWSEYLRRVLVVRPECDAALTLLLCCCPAWLLVRLVRPAGRRGVPEGSASTPRRERENAALLLLLLVLPGLTLGILTFATGHPFLSPMYSMYDTVALYIALGAMVSRIRRPIGRVAVTLAVAALYAYQLAILLPEVTRTNWQAGASYIEQQGAPGDLILDMETVWPGNYLPYYLPGRANDIQRITTFQAACDRAVTFLREQPPEDDVRVWFVFEKAYLLWFFPDYDVPRSFEQRLVERGLGFTHKEFLGQYDLQVYCIRRNPGEMPRDTREPVPGLMQIDYTDVLKELGLSYPDEAGRTEAIAALREEIGIWPPYCKFFLLIHGLDFLQQGHPDLAEAVFDRAIDQYPVYDLAYFSKGLARAAKGDCPGAQDAFRQAFRLYKPHETLFGPVVSALCETPDPEAARAEIARLETMQSFFVPALKQVYRARFGSEP